MLFVIIGIALIALNLAGIGPTAAWSWEFTGDLWKFTVPFILAVLWWTWADKSGLNRRREIEKMEVKKENRRKHNLASLGIGDDNKSRRKP